MTVSILSIRTVTLGATQYFLLGEKLNSFMICKIELQLSHPCNPWCRVHMVAKRPTQLSTIIEIKENKRSFQECLAREVSVLGWAFWCCRVWVFRFVCLVWNFFQLGAVSLQILGAIHANLEKAVFLTSRWSKVFSKTLGMPLISGVGEAKIGTVRIQLLKLISYTGEFGVEGDQLLHQQLRLSEDVRDFVDYPVLMP